MGRNGGKDRAMCKVCLIAEHDLWDIRLLRIYVERLGFRLIQAFDGSDVLQLARAEQPDVIILDGDLPGSLRADAVLQALKSDPDTRDVPLILLSWMDDEAASEAVPDAAGYLRKPATYDDFRAALMEVGACAGAMPEGR